MAQHTASLRLDEPSARRPPECPVEDWLAFLGHRWNALVLWHLKDGPKRHGELASLLPGITPKVLVERLQGLENRGLVLRSPRLAYPRSVTYALSRRGEQLTRILDQIETWSALMERR
ncbi:winged helix-turn-helix transcriptional regulator [Pseudorhodoplanes sinuspersici]|uniref:Transcriptional regulator n=1 Tax=Pseudorhodoplanes sinuspersici TaxID=1235591 RepID=A0A1W7A1Y6_9HYPH|nr:helix-turn-helix domain-containing protein [Pseudorhodoplanes sinuspersici]ARQ03055.1 transcriptional regulator [Pseudorhodoplanes sinuspersici]